MTCSKNLTSGFDAPSRHWWRSCRKEGPALAADRRPARSGSRQCQPTALLHEEQTGWAGRPGRGHPRQTTPAFRQPHVPPRLTQVEPWPELLERLAVVAPLRDDRPEHRREGVPWHPQPVRPRPVLPGLVYKTLAHVEYHRTNHAPQVRAREMSCSIGCSQEVLGPDHRGSEFETAGKIQPDTPKSRAKANMATVAGGTSGRRPADRLLPSRPSPCRRRRSRARGTTVPAIVLATGD